MYVWGCVHVFMCMLESRYECLLEVGDDGGRCWAHLSMIIKATAVVTKLSLDALLLSAASILREQQTHYREGREKKRKKGSGKERRGERSEGSLWLKD